MLLSTGCFLGWRRKRGSRCVPQTFKVLSAQFQCHWPLHNFIVCPWTFSAFTQVFFYCTIHIDFIVSSNKPWGKRFKLSKHCGFLSFIQRTRPSRARDKVNKIQQDGGGGGRGEMEEWCIDFNHQCHAKLARWSLNGNAHYPPVDSGRPGGHHLCPAFPRNKARVMQAPSTPTRVAHSVEAYTR